MKSTKNMSKRALSLLLALVMCFGMVNLSAFAVTDAAAEHTHNQDGWTCTQAEPTKSLTCTHVHDEPCGYVAPTEEVPCDKECTDTDGDGIIDHAENCAYQPAVEGVDCNHEHTEACYTTTEGAWTCTPPVVEVTEEPELTESANGPQKTRDWWGGGTQTQRVYLYVRFAKDAFEGWTLNADGWYTYGYIDVSGILENAQSLNTSHDATSEQLEQVKNAILADNGNNVELYNVAIDLAGDNATWTGTTFRNLHVQKNATDYVSSGDLTWHFNILVNTPEALPELSRTTYTVNYLEKGTGKVLHDAKANVDTVVGTKIAAEDEVIEIDGYKYDSADKNSITVVKDETKNVLNLYYTKTDPEPETTTVYVYVTSDKPVEGWTKKNEDAGNWYTIGSVEVPISVLGPASSQPDAFGNNPVITYAADDVRDAVIERLNDMVLYTENGSVPNRIDGKNIDWKTNPMGLHTSNGAMDYVHETRNEWHLDGKIVTTPPTPEVPNITVTKTAEKTEYTVGETVTWDITVENKGTTTVEDLRLVDILNGKTGLVTVAAKDPSNNNPNSFSLEAGATATFTATLEKAPVSFRYLNKVEVKKGDDLLDDDTAENVKVVEKETPAAPNITISKTADKDNVNVGDTVTFTITVKNDGTGAATNVVVTDTMPEGLAPQGTTTFDIGTLEAGGTRTLNLTATVMKAGEITNTAKVTWDDGNEKTDSATITGVETGGIEIEKTRVAINGDAAKTVAKVGDTITWDVKVTNNSNVKKTVTLTDKLTGATLKWKNVLLNITRPVENGVTLNAGESVTLIAAYTVTGEEKLDKDGKLFNTVVGTTPDGGKAEDTDDGTAIVKTIKVDIVKGFYGPSEEAIKAIQSNYSISYSYDLNDAIVTGTLAGSDAVMKEYPTLFPSEMYVTLVWEGVEFDVNGGSTAAAGYSNISFTETGHDKVEGWTWYDYDEFYKNYAGVEYWNMTGFSGPQALHAATLSIGLSNFYSKTPTPDPEPVTTTLTLSYDANGGSNAPAADSKTVNAGASATFTVKGQENMFREGYTFQGWAASRNGEVVYHANSSITISENTTLYAVWSYNGGGGSYDPTYRVTYEWSGLPENASARLPGGGRYSSNTKVNVNTSYAEGTKLVVDGETYSFSGWTTEDVTVDNGSFRMPSKTVTLVGVWTMDVDEGDTPLVEPDTFKLTVHYVYADGSTAAEDSVKDGLLAGDSYSVVSPVLEGYTVDYELVAGTMPGEDLEFTVVYTPVETEVPEEQPPLVEVPEEQPPLVDVPEEQPPLVDIPVVTVPAENVPVVTVPVEDVPLADIPDEDVPMVGVPQTGDFSMVWCLAAMLSVTGLIVLTFKKREDEEI